MNNALSTLKGFRCYSPCPRLATGAPWYIGNRHIGEDLVVPFLADHIRALNESFDKDTVWGTLYLGSSSDMLFED